MKKLIIMILPLLSVLGFAGCKEDDKLPPKVPTANLLIYNGSASLQNIGPAIVYLDTTDKPKDYSRMTIDYNYVYPGGYTGIPSQVAYMNVKPGKRRLRFSLPDSTGVTDHVFDMADGSYQSIYIADSLSYYNVLYTRDTLVRLQDKGRLRLINLSPDAGKVQLYLDTVAISGLSSDTYKQVTPFVPVNTNLYVAVIIKSLKDPLAPRTLIRKSIPIIAGRSYTAILRGYIAPPDGNPNNSINLSVLINQ